MHPMGIGRLPRWLQDVILATRPYKRHHKRHRPPRHATIESCERRILLADTFPIYGTPGADTIILRWGPLNHMIVYSFNGGLYAPVPNIDENTDEPITHIRVTGHALNDTLIIDLSYGRLSQALHNPSIEFIGGTHFNTLVVRDTAAGSAGDDSIIFEPDDSYSSPTDNFIANGTAVTYGNVNAPVFQLHGGNSNSVTVQGSANHTMPLEWNDTLFNPADNPNLSLTVNPGGEVTFADDAALASLQIRGAASDPGQVRLQHSGSEPAIKLTTHSLQIDAANNAVLDVSNNALDVHYSSGSPAAILRGYLKSGMGEPRSGAPYYGTGNWDGAAGIKSSAAEGNFPAALGYVDDATNEVVRVRFGVYGDANLDGRVDITDLGLLATNWQSSSSWAGGEFNYDGIIDESDRRLLSMTWQSGVSPFGLSRKTSSLYSARAVDRELEGHDL